MEIAEARKINKSTWGDGPWQYEPDRIEWQRHGMPCLMLRTEHGGNWCGYVAVNPGHPWHGLGYTSCTQEKICEKQKAEGYCEHTPEHLIQVHGGLTYANECAGHICHAPKPGEPDNVFWFGFDCAHAGDGIPGMAKLLSNADGFFSKGYKDVAYVRREVERLADQLKAVA